MAEKAGEAIEASKKIDAQLKEELKREQEKKAAEQKKSAEEKGQAQATSKPAAPPQPVAEKKEEKKIVLDRTFTVPFSKAFRKPRSHRGRIAVSLLKQFVVRHAKTSLAKVRVEEEVNSLVLARGSRNPPKKLRVRVAKDDQGIARVAAAK